MCDSEIEIVVDDPTAPALGSPAVASTHAAEMVVSWLLLGLALLLGYDN
jgi:putative tricarboxylic transport membrane protein